MYEALLVVFLIVAIGLVGLIMLQQGKGADMGAPSEQALPLRCLVQVVLVTS